MRPSSSSARIAPVSTAVDVPDPADVHRFAVDVRVALGGGHDVGVLAGHADGERAVLVEQVDQLALHLSGQHHPDDVHRLRSGHPQPGLELRVQAEPFQLRADLRAAAVHHDGTEPGLTQEDDVLREGGLQLLVHHGVPAELDHDRPAVVTGQPGQRLDEDLRLGQCGVPAGGMKRSAHELYALFSWT